METGEWVQISQLFGSTQKRSKLVPHSFGRVDSAEGRRQAVTELTKVANTGYAPSYDIYEPFKDQEKGILPFDLDIPSRMKRNSPAIQATRIMNLIARMCRHHPEEIPGLAKIAIETANFRLKRHLKKTMKRGR